MKNPLKRIEDFGQSIWLDYIRRSFIHSGALKSLIDNDGLKGLTSNPAIFEEAIAHSDDYTDVITASAKSGKSAEEIFLDIAIKDVQDAADLFNAVYIESGGLDGYVSLEVSPGLALNTKGTIAEAHASWKRLDRKNVMIKVPGTAEGIPAVKTLISEGINVNVTLLFSLECYREVAEAYIAGLEERVTAGLPVNGIASVASFFLSRIDTIVDPMLAEMAEQNPERARAAMDLFGEVAIASARGAYRIFLELFKSERFRALEDKGAKPQRLLWASTGTKNKTYSDTMYIEALIGPETVNTVPKETLEAYRDHGSPSAQLEANLEKARQQLDSLINFVGIDLNAVTDKLQQEGIEKFMKPFNSLMQMIELKKGEAFL